MTKKMMNEEENEIEKKEEQNQELIEQDAKEESDQAEPKYKKFIKESLQIIVVSLIAVSIVFGFLWGVSVASNPQEELREQYRAYKTYAETVKSDAIGVYSNTKTSQKSDWYILSANGDAVLINITGEGDSLVHTETVLDTENPNVQKVLSDIMR